MKTHRFIGEFNLNQNKISITDPDVVNQIRQVLHLKIGERIVLGDGYGEEAIAEITGFGKDSVELSILEKYKNQTEPKTKVVLYCSVLKKENFEWVVQKATETGATEIIPVISERTIKLNLNLERLQKIAREATEQSGRGVMPKIGETLNFKEAIEKAKKENPVNVFFDSSGKTLNEIKLGKKIGLFIGPEGGWSENEKKLAEENGLEILSLSLLTLRAETAAIIATYLASSQD